MKYHKIRNIPLEICTSEQKIAYNLAFSNAHLFLKDYNSVPLQFQKSEIIHEAVNFCMKQWSYNKSVNKYDIDSIFCALNSGLETYIKKHCPILQSYEQIGDMFKAYYIHIND